MVLVRLSPACYLHIWFIEFSKKRKTGWKNSELTGLEYTYTLFRTYRFSESPCSSTGWDDFSLLSEYTIYTCTYIWTMLYKIPISISNHDAFILFTTKMFSTKCLCVFFWGFVYLCWFMPFISASLFIMQSMCS